MTEEYKFKDVEKKWQENWELRNSFRAKYRSSKPKYYILDMFPYPSGHGLHVGHLKGYIASDVTARYMRARGYNVLHPMGWDSFGLPTERQAEKDNISPQEVTERNVNVFKRQLMSVGISYDWSREFATSDASYFKWTQWIFSILYQRGLAYESEVPVNWCPALGTVVANEEVQNDAYIETGDPVEPRMMKQWLLRITQYADRLLEDLDELDWPESVKSLQRNWIGRRDGAEIDFQVDGVDARLNVFTTRPETLFGATFCALAPDHELVDRVTIPSQKSQVKEFIHDWATSKTDNEFATDEKTGVFTGGYAINPVDGRHIPIWVANYVLSEYGTGAIFGCPAHDERDLEFANNNELDVIQVVEDDGGLGEKMVNSDEYDGMSVAEAREAIISRLEDLDAGRRQVNYHLNDWLFSRQRYWGEPIPLIHVEDGSVELDNDLPLLLPRRDDYKSDGVGEEEPRTPLSLYTDWVEMDSREDGKTRRRETNVMPQWAGSCWYYLRFIDPHNDSIAWDSKLESHWMPVDLYVGGIEHATLHLLYARFWHKVLYDAGYVTTNEPFKKLVNQGKIQARSFRDESGHYHYPSEVVEKDGEWYLKERQEIGPLRTRIEKMSKSKYNVVTPEEVIDVHGADSLRLYELFLGPLEQDNIWLNDGLSGTSRFLGKVWRLFRQSLREGKPEESEELDRLLHKTIRKVTEDLDHYRYNTCVSQLMIFVNEAAAAGGVSINSLRTFIVLLSPFAPHMSEEMWERIGETGFVVDAKWPEFDQALTEDSLSTVVIQVDGKLRGKLEIEVSTAESELYRLALEQETVLSHVSDPEKVRLVSVPGKLINIVNTTN